MLQNLPILHYPSIHYLSIPAVCHRDRLVAKLQVLCIAMDEYIQGTELKFFSSGTCLGSYVVGEEAHGATPSLKQPETTGVS